MRAIAQRMQRHKSRVSQMMTAAVGKMRAVAMPPLPASAVHEIHQ